ncbi:hemerythrin family protein [Carboxylicivirga sediminis]|uniref:Hemerythrin family protein n=1 Tax=Carboxylicivirga sediminis TaxID=2006564 RepID=A0A941IZ69_9BACT|nr:bacteriohemerythrin [Carboxylicivirga sediminis]MBR8536472.1 hemerythrin family protein [Carboxylicivirga sediminis]
MWTEDLSVNNAVIDNEHKELFALIDNFYKGIKDNSPRERLEELILGLVAYTKTHFANEEDHMRRMNYPNLKEHQMLHKEFIDKTQSYYERLKGGKLILSIEVTNFLKEWLVKHIKGTDQQYAAFESMSKV